MGEERVMPYFVDNFGYWILFNREKFFGPIFCVTALMAFFWCRNKKMRYSFVSFGVYFAVNLCIYYVVTVLSLMYAIRPKSSFGWRPGVMEDGAVYVAISGTNIFILKVIYDIIILSKIRHKKTVMVTICIVYALLWNLITLLESLSI